MALLGFIKFLPIGLFAVILMQRPELRIKLLDGLPNAAVCLTLISFIGSRIPVLKEYIVVAGRFGGTFQYPNTFAVLLLVAFLYLMHKKETGKKEIAQAAVLIGGIFACGSRTVFILLPVAVAASFFILAEKKKKRALLAMTIAMVITGAVVLIVSGGGALSRILQISLSESTLLGRLLYAKDALSVIARNPLGLGYLGYYFTQGAFQTGVYSVNHVHNEFLQLFLDIGWLPGLTFAAVFIYGIFKSDSSWQRLLLITFGAHAFVDFDFQFVAMYMIFMLLLPWENGTQFSLTVPKAMSAAGILLSVVLLYVGIGNAAYYFGGQNLAEAFYPQNTLLKSERLKQAGSYDEMDDIADDILRCNEAVALAWDAKARASFVEGDVQKMMEYKQRAISLSKYNVEEYEDYLDMLFAAAQLYKEVGDKQSAEYCLQTASEIPELLKKVEGETDRIAWKLADRPELELSDEYKVYLGSLIN